MNNVWIYSLELGWERQSDDFETAQDHIQGNATIPCAVLEILGDVDPRDDWDGVYQRAACYCPECGWIEDGCHEDDCEFDGLAII